MDYTIAINIVFGLVCVVLAVLLRNHVEGVTKFKCDYDAFKVDVVEKMNTMSVTQSKESDSAHASLRESMALYVTKSECVQCKAGNQDRLDSGQTVFENIANSLEALHDGQEMMQRNQEITTAAIKSDLTQMQQTANRVNLVFSRTLLAMCKADGADCQEIESLHHHLQDVEHTRLAGGK